MELRVTLAGRVGIEAAGERLEAVGVGRLGRVAFAYLVMERRRPVPRDELADVLWGESLPASWTTSLRVLISKLRTFLSTAGVAPRDALVAEQGCFQLVLRTGAVVDIEESANAVESAQEIVGSDPAKAIELVSRALEVLSAPLLSDGSGPWVERRQAEHRELHLRALEVLAAAFTDSGDSTQAVRAAEDAIAIEQFREGAWLCLIEAHAGAGNRGEALRAYERCRKVLVESLGIGPSAAIESVYLGLLQEPDPTRPRPVAPAPFPVPLTSFIGRQRDLQDITAALGTARLLTLTGTGGVGKTRLALEVAARARAKFDRAVYAALDGLDPSTSVESKLLAAEGIAESPGLDPRDTLARALGSSRTLVVLDDCDHALESTAPLVEHLLLACEGVTVLATSREPLAVPGETIWPVDPLPVPTSTEIGRAGRVARRGGTQRPERSAGPGGGTLRDRTRPADRAAEVESVQLLVDRCQSVVPGFALNDDSAVAAVAICRGLEGIPLAIELAAARVSGLSLVDIAARLEDRLELLSRGPRTAPARQRTLRGTVEWSYETLSESEQSLFDQLAVFSGGFTLDAATTVCLSANPSSVTDVVARLVEVSLLTAEDAGTGPQRRYRFLETIREFGRERLRGADPTEVTQRRHLDWALDFARAAHDELGEAGDTGAWLDQLSAEHDNFGAALAWASSRRGAERKEGLALAVALARFWEVRGHLTEGRHWLEALIGEGDVGLDSEPELRAQALNGAGVLAQLQGDYSAAEQHFQASLALARDAAERAAMAAALHGLGNLAALQGDPAARIFFEESLAIGEEIDDQRVVAASLSNLGTVAQNEGNLARAEDNYDKALQAWRLLGDERGEAMVLSNLGFLAFQRGQFGHAKELDDESLLTRRGLGDPHGVAMVMGNLGHLALHEGDRSRARECYEHCLAARRALGDRHGQAGALANLSDLARVEGDLTAARHFLEEGLDLARNLGDRYRGATILARLARVANLEGDHPVALRRAAEAMDAAAEVVPATTYAESLEAAATGAAGIGELDSSAFLLGAAAAVRERAGIPLAPRDAEELSAVRSDVERHLKKDVFAAASSAGAQATEDEARGHISRMLDGDG